LVERNLAKVDVAGSSPVSRSLKKYRNPISIRNWVSTLLGGVAKRSKAKVCKTFIRRFESDRRLQTFLNYIYFSMYFVYILQSEKNKKRYIGFTENLDRRLIEHNSGLVKSTRNRKPMKLIYFEEFKNKVDAVKREKEIKAKKGKFIIPH
jgi:putative endonuclease